MAIQRRARARALRPAFVLTTAALSTACSALGVSGEITNPPPPQPTHSENPPPPEPIPPPRPDFGATVTQAKPPPALGAATLAITADGATAIASDPDRDRVLLVDIAAESHRVREVALAEGDEPGRLVIDRAGAAHVVLRGVGAVASIELATGAVRERRAVCASPQGLAADGETLYVTCEGGELATLPVAAGGAASILARLDRDLRDVVVHDDALLVSRLRSAEVLRVGKKDGAPIARARPALEGPQHPADVPPSIEPFVGYRLVRAPGGALLVHQVGTMDEVHVEQPQAYASPAPCGGPVGTTVSTFDTAGGAIHGTLGSFVGHAVVPVDLARAGDGEHLALIAAGNGHTRELPQVHLLLAREAQRPGDCLVQDAHGGRVTPPPPNLSDPPGQAVAVTFTPDSRSIAVFTREPAALHLRTVASFGAADTPWLTIALGGASREDTGHAVFNSNSGGGIACVSCHPDGADDGRVWRFSTGERRTQSLRGTLDGTAPYHWGGDAPGLETFATDVFVDRMGGGELAADQVEALRAWLVRLPPPRVSPARPGDEAAARRGEALFERQDVGCTTCHAGARPASNASVDVGTGGAFQVPSLLGLASRAPYLHDGRADALGSLWSSSGSGLAHGTSVALTPAEIADLVVYLETL